MKRREEREIIVCAARDRQVGEGGPVVVPVPEPEPEPVSGQYSGGVCLGSVQGGGVGGVWAARETLIGVVGTGTHHPRAAVKREVQGLAQLGTCIGTAAGTCAQLREHRR